MKIKDILKGAATVAGTVNPALGAVIGVVNTFLPEEDKLPDTATGSIVEAKIASLPPEQRQSIYEKEIDLKIAQEEGWTNRYEAMCKGDTQSTRPWIAKQMTRVLCFEILAFTVWTFTYPEQINNPMLWTVFGTLTGVPATVLLNYFGNLRKEQGQRMSALIGSPPIGMIGNIIKSLK